MGKLVRVAVMGLLLALALYSAPIANASARRSLAGKTMCRSLGICRDGCNRCWSNLDCAIEGDVCLCGASICP